MKIPFSPPDISELEINEVINVLRSGWITTGPKTKEFERKIAEFTSAEKCVCLNSQTACAEMTLRVLGIGEGDEVIVPAYTYTATASVAAHVGARIVTIDCEKGKFTMDYDMLEAAVTERTKAIIPVDLFGIPADYDRIFEIAENKKNLFRPSENKLQKAIGRVAVVADGAHSFGAVYKGKSASQFPDFTNFSFHAVKNLTTAEGGAVVWNNFSGIDNEELYRSYMLLSLHGQSKDALSKNKAGSWEYDVTAPLYKCNMTDIHAAVGVGQIKRYDKILSRRKEIIEKYNSAFSELPLSFPEHFSENFRSSGHLYPIRLNGYTAEQRNEFIIRLAEMGVSSNVHYKPLPLLTAYKNIGFRIEDFPNAYNQFANEVTLPLNTCLSDDEVEFIIECVKKILT